MVKKCWFFGLLVLLLFVGVRTDAITLNFEGLIADEANVLSQETKKGLNFTLGDLQKKTGADLVVVTLPNLGGRDVKDVALDIGRSYKLGAKGKNNGVVFLTALNERRMDIEFGTGLEDKIDMKEIESIRDYDIIPYFQRGDYESGIARGTYLLIDTVARIEGVGVLKQGYCPPQKSRMTSKERRQQEPYPWYVYVLAFIYAIVGGGCRRRYYDNYGSGYSGGGSFGGGGGFGGCGCSGSW